VTKTERNAPFDSGSISAQNQHMTFRISFGLYPLFGCYLQISNDHLHPCPYELNGTTTTLIILCYINSVTISTYVITFTIGSINHKAKCMCGKIPCSLKISSVLHFKQQNTEIHFLLLSSRPTYRLQRAYGIGTELFAERSQLPDMLHTQRPIYFGLSYAAIGPKEIHFTHTHKHRKTGRRAHTHTHTNLSIRHTKSSLFLFCSKE